MATQNPYGTSTPTAGGIDVGGSSNTVSDTAAGLSGQAHGAAQAVTSKAHEVAGQAREAASGLADQARGAVDDLRGQANKYKDQALDQARTAAEDGKTKAVDAIHGVADTLRSTGQQLGQNQTIAPVGRIAAQAADALEGFAGRLREKDIDQLVEEVSTFVRRNPAIAVGVAVAAGFALTQLLRGGSGMGMRQIGGGQFGGTQFSGSQGGFQSGDDRFGG